MNDRNDIIVNTSQPNDVGANHAFARNARHCAAMMADVDAVASRAGDPVDRPYAAMMADVDAVASRAGDPVDRPYAATMRCMVAMSDAKRRTGNDEQRIITETTHGC